MRDFLSIPHLKAITFIP